MNTFDNFEDWWEIKGSKMKNEPGENINDTELPLRIAIAAWEAMNTRTMPTFEEVLKNGATASDFEIPESEIEYADKIAREVQNDLEDTEDARDAHLIAEEMRETAESLGFVIRDGIWDAMQEAFVQAIAQDTLGKIEATQNLNKAMLDYFETQGEEYE